MVLVLATVQSIKVLKMTLLLTDVNADYLNCFCIVTLFEGYTILCLTFFIVQYGQTPLHYASMLLQRIEAMKILTDNGADLDVTDKVSHCQS